MGMPVIIDNAVYEKAKTEAQIEYRIIAGQIEFWAMVGRVALNNPESLYKALVVGSQPRFATISKVIHALGLKIGVHA